MDYFGKVPKKGISFAARPETSPARHARLIGSH